MCYSYKINIFINPTKKFLSTNHILFIIIEATIACEGTNSTQTVYFC